MDWQPIVVIIISTVASTLAGIVAVTVKNRSPETQAAVQQTATSAALQVVNALQTQVNGLQRDLDEEREERRRERETLQAEINQLRQENVTLRGQVQALQLENDTLKSRNGGSRGGLGSKR